MPGETGALGSGASIKGMRPNSSASQQNAGIPRQAALQPRRKGASRLFAVRRVFTGFHGPV